MIMCVTNVDCIIPGKPNMLYSLEHYLMSNETFGHHLEKRQLGKIWR